GTQHFEADSMPFTLLNPSQPAQPAAQEAESPGFSLQNNSTSVNPGAPTFEAESIAFILFNTSQATVSVFQEANGPAFTVVKSTPTTGVAFEADSHMFSLLNNNASVTPGAKSFEAESLMFSLQNLIPRTEAESLTFTLLNQGQPAAPIFHEADGLPFSAQNTAPPPPHVVRNFETESALFSLLNSNATIPGASSPEAESSVFTLRNDSQPATRSAFEMESASFSVLNRNSGNPGINNFEVESLDFSVRNQIPPPVPGKQHFEADSLPFTLLNPAQPLPPVAHESASPAFSLLNNMSSVNPGVGNFEAESNAFSLLNRAPASAQRFEAAGPMFSIRNTITTATAKGTTPSEATRKKQTKRPTTSPVPVASLKSISSSGERANSRTSRKGRGNSPAASPRPTVSPAASPISERATTNSNEQQRSQNVSPTLENHK